MFFGNSTCVHVSLLPQHYVYMLKCFLKATCTRRYPLLSLYVPLFGEIYAFSHRFFSSASAPPLRIIFPLRIDFVFEDRLSSKYFMWPYSWLTTNCTGIIFPIASIAPNGQINQIGFDTKLEYGRWTHTTQYYEFFLIKENLTLYRLIQSHRICN